MMYWSIIHLRVLLLKIPKDCLIGISGSKLCDLFTAEAPPVHTRNIQNHIGFYFFFLKLQLLCLQKYTCFINREAIQDITKILKDNSNNQ